MWRGGRAHPFGIRNVHMPEGPVLVASYNCSQLSSRGGRTRYRDLRIKPASRPSCRSSWSWSWFSPERPLPRCGRDAFATAANDSFPPIPWKKTRSPVQNIDGW